MAIILLADDEETIRNTVTWYLESEGFQVFAAADGHEALEIETTHHPDLIILDVMMPRLQGWEVARTITRQVPIIFLTALGHESDKMTGFNLGADDYVTKPFSPRELTARVKVILRRYGILDKHNYLQIGSLRVIPATRMILFDDTVVALSTKEFELIHFLARHPKLVFTRDELGVNVWGYNYEGDARVVDTTVKRLRIKLGDYRHYLQTIHGAGYRLDTAKS